MASDQPQWLSCRERGLGVARGVVLWLLPGVAVWVVLGLLAWLVIT